MGFSIIHLIVLLLVAAIPVGAIVLAVVLLGKRKK